MTQLLCNGVLLDLYDDISLQFTKVNPLFAFDEMAAERTTQFKLPSTPTNDRVLSLARIPAYSGEGMRRRFECELQCGMLVRKGFLYISSFDGSDYSAVLVTGMLYNIKTFGNHEWGSLVFNSFLSATEYDSDDGSLPMMARVKYHDDTTYPTGQEWRRYTKPSINIGQLLAELNTQGVLPITGIDPSLQLRLIRKGEQYAVVDTREQLNMTSTTPTLTTQQNIVEIGFIPTKEEDHPEGQTWGIDAFEGNVQVQFPENTPDNLCICVAGGWVSDGTYKYQKIDFVGSRRFKRPSISGGQTEYEGEPLAGQTITIENDFILLTGADLDYNPNEPNIYFDELRMVSEPLYSLDVRIWLSHPWYQGECPWNSLLNDLDLGMLIHYYCACSGLLFGQHKDETFEFVSAVSGAVIEPEIESISEVQRTFGSYVQKNVVAFDKNESNMLPGEDSTMEYTIDNDNLAEEKALDTLKVAEGGIYEDEDNILYIRGAKWVEPALEPMHIELPKDTACESVAYEYMQRATLRKNAYLQTLCDMSTMVKVTARMSCQQFSEIDSFTRFLVRNTLYVWTEAQWQNDTAQFTLAKVR